MGALTNYLLLHTNKPEHKVLHNIPDHSLPVKDHRPVTSIHVEESRVDYSSTDCKTLIILRRSDLNFYLTTFLLSNNRACSVESTHHAKLAKSVENLRRHNENLNLKIWGKCKRVIKFERSKFFPLLALKLLLLPPLPALILPFLSSQPI